MQRLLGVLNLYNRIGVFESTLAFWYKCPHKREGYLKYVHTSINSNVIRIKIHLIFYTHTLVSSFTYVCLCHNVSNSLITVFSLTKPIRMEGVTFSPLDLLLPGDFFRCGNHSP